MPTAAFAASRAILAYAGLPATPTAQKLVNFQSCTAPLQCQSNLCIQQQCVPSLLPPGHVCGSDNECQAHLCHKEPNTPGGGVCALPGQKSFTRADFQRCNANAQCASGVCDAELQGCVPKSGLLPGFRATRANFCASKSLRVLDASGKVASCTTPSGSRVNLVAGQRCGRDSDCNSRRCRMAKAQGSLLTLTLLNYQTCNASTGAGSGYGCSVDSDCASRHCVALLGIGVCSPSPKAH
ncbi:MAG: hypothetical protein JST92_10490 [Deltaproteobacteria bacterium]|nr:hypothetical protein [Deltaproteobacteria bacterium]